MTSISAKPLLDFVRALNAREEIWQGEVLHELEVREIKVQVTGAEEVTTALNTLLASYGPALKDVSLRFVKWLEEAEADQEREPFERREEFQLAQDPGKLAELLNDKDFGKVEIRLKLRINKNELIKDWLQQQGQALPPGVEPRLVFFRETLAALFQGSITEIAEWWTPGISKLVVLCPEWQGFLKGPYLAVAGGDPLATWRLSSPQPHPHQDTSDPSDTLSPGDLYKARAKDQHWLSGSVPALTPLHLEIKGDAPADDPVANALHVHAIDLCLLYTANHVDTHSDWQEWDSFYKGAGKTSGLDYEVAIKSAPPDRPLGEAGAVAARDMTELVKWCYGKGFSGDKLSFFQSAVARLLKGHDPQQAFGALINEVPNIWPQIVTDWQMFVEGKLDEFGDQVRALEDYVATTAQAFSDQVSGLIKGLSETMLAAVAVLLGAFIAALFNKDATPEILAISVAIYLIYLLVFPLLYNMRERRESYEALVEQFERRRVRFNTALSEPKVKTIVHAPITRSRQRFESWFWLIVATYLAMAAVLWCLVPWPVDSAAYEPPPSPRLTGALRPNVELRHSRRIAAGRLAGSEAVAVAADGRLYTGTADGKVMRITTAPDGAERLEVFAETGGRPLGLKVREATAAAPWALFVADARKGLLAVDASGGVKSLATSAAGVPFGFTNDLDVATDGKIYFSDSSTRFGIDRYLYDLLESRPHGRLLVYDPEYEETKVLLDGLFFANGVALSRGEDFVLVAETYRYRIRRYWLKGDKAGTSDVFADDLPGFPDNLTVDRGRGRFWVALFTVRNAVVDFLHPHPFLKTQLAKLPRFLWPKPEPYGLVLEMDETGKVVRSLHDPGGHQVRGVTSAQPHGEQLYLGSLDEGITLWLGPAGSR